MKRLTLASLPVLAAVLGACASIETVTLETQASPFPEPPPWNSLEMMWMDTEIVQVTPAGSPTSS
jgi:hypothetical protein